MNHWSNIFIFMCASVIGFAQNEVLLSYNSDTITFYSNPLSDDFSISDTISIENGSLFNLEKSFVQLQTNGPGSLITPFIHGLGARHTAVIWNGLNIQSPVNGTIDLNLLSGFEEVTISPSSISAFVGTAGLSGALHLQGFRDERFQLTGNFSDMKNIDLGISKNWKNNTSGGYFQVDLLRHQNQYRFNNLVEITTQNNAELDGLNIASGWNGFIGDDLKFSLDVWGQKYDRSIAAAKTAIYNGGRQMDRNLRAHAGLASEKSQLNIGYLSEKLVYSDAAILSDAVTKSLLFNIGHDFGWINSFLSYRNDKVEASFYTEKYVRNTWAVQLHKQIRWQKRMVANIVIRNEFFDDYQSPLLFLLSNKYQVGQDISLKLAFDKSYNIPAFNDLYWPSGGNPDLKPEKSIGFNAETVYNRSGFTTSALLYYKKVNDWIAWVPGPVFWSPVNQRNVLSRGLDLFASLKTNYSNYGIELSPHFHYNKTTIAEDEDYPEFVGNQVIYVPETRWGVTGRLTRSRWKFTLDYSTFGHRYLGFDNAEILSGFNVLNLSLDYDLQDQFILSLDVNNLLNEDYERVAFYAMPLRNINFGFKVEL